MTDSPGYWLPSWWDLPTPGHKWHRVINGNPATPPTATTAASVTVTPDDFSDGGPSGPPPAAGAVGVAVDEDALHEVSRIKKLRERQQRMLR